MLLRSIFELSSRRAVSRIPRQTTTTQIPKSLRKDFSTKPQPPRPNGLRKPPEQPPRPNGSQKPPESATTASAGGSGSSVSKVIVGGAFVGAAVLAAYQTGYLDQVLGGKDHQNEPLKEVEDSVEAPDVKEIRELEDDSVLPEGTEVNEVASNGVDEKVVVASTGVDEKVEVDSTGGDEKVENSETLPDHSGVEAHSLVEDDKSEATHIEVDDLIKAKKDLEDFSQRSTVSEDQSLSSGVLLSEGTPELESTGKEEDAEKGSDEKVQTSPVFDKAVEESEVKVEPNVPFTIEERNENAPSKDVDEHSSLLEEYNLEDADGSSYTSLYKHGGNDHDLLAREEALSSALEDSGDAYISKDGKLVLDFLQAIHAAESRQAELDSRMYAAEKKALKEKYEKELKDAAIRELMLAEEAAMLDRELKREKTKAAAALKSLQEQLEEKYKNELENKKRIAENKLKKVEELSKAELSAKIASEKAAQIEKISEANLHINALCMAFYARSEEARRSHSAHKLALGALALEDSLSKGLPIQTEIAALHSYLEGIDKDSVLGLVLSSLPDETRNNGSDTLLQLNQKFNALKGTLRHFSLIPPGGGGILAHSVARIASWLKVKETDQSGDGIESLINKVETHLADGKIVEAADALEQGVQGTEASEIVGDWVRRARNRAITEQALSLLQSYAISISVT